MAAEEHLHRSDADFKKVPGTLTLTPTYIAWVPKEKDRMDRQQQAMNRAINMLASKAGSERVSLKILFKDDLPAGGLFFTFTNPATREDDRKLVQDTLIPFVSANRAGPSTPVAPASPAVASPSTNAAEKVMSANAKGKRKADDASPVPVTNGQSKSRPTRYKVMQKVLNKNPNLKLLHRELVLGKQITEEEFWEGREALIEAEELALAQRPGRQSRLLDDRFDLDSGKKAIGGQGGTGVGVKTKTENGPVVLNLSKELTREIFEEFPVVQDAYAKFVPGISEAEFWSRYFQSQLWERHRASVRQSAADEVNKRKDDIFDQYLEDPDWDIQPRNAQPDAEVVRFLDLAATEEDHGESITVRDHTMQAGRERTALPLIRRFNDHSNKLLRAGGKAQPITSADENNIYDEIDLEDLRGPAQVSTIALDVQDDGDIMDNDDTGAVRGILPGKTDDDLAEIARNEASRFKDWRPDFNQISLPTPPGGWQTDQQAAGYSDEQADRYQRYQSQKEGGIAAMQVVRDMHVASNAEHAASTPFPDALLEQMKSCHNAATEFLRQYWSAVLPTSSAALGAGTAATNAATKSAKAAKMAQYLSLTEGKVIAVVHTATIERIDPARVRAVLAPTLGAVNVALARERKRVANAS